MTPANWHPDPTGRHELRYWDGAQWTEHVSDQGTVGSDPLEASSSPEQSQYAEQGHAETQLIDARELAAEQPVAAAAEQPAEVSADPVTGWVQPSAEPPAYTPSGPGLQGTFAGISGDLIDGRFSEVSGTGATLQNKKLLRVRIDQPFLARHGAMVAYQGAVDFAYQGSGAARFLKKAFTGEGLSLMQVSGQGDVFLADEAKDVHVLHLDNSGLSVNGKNVLAFSSSLDWNIERVKGGSIAAGGLFNTTLRGTGWVAILTDGEPVVLDAQEAPTFADANALVAWSIHLQTSIRSSFTAGALIGRGSGEAFQVAFQGPGFVIVQPSEGSSVPPHTH
ncbi:MAG TPA: AIM24 family protein [Nocardioides sp.]|nr:AIM24 family protein [Nocardioides sp.]